MQPEHPQPEACESRRDGFSWGNCLFDKALESPWETIYFNDRMVKHEVRPFHREAGRSGPCHREVIVNFVRKPLSDGSDFRHCEDEDEDSEDPRDEARSPRTYANARKKINQKTQNKIPRAVPPPRWRRPDCYITALFID